jgi:hypothetical protein
LSGATHTLDLIKELSKALRDSASLKEAEEWWNMFLRIESDLEYNPNTTKHQHKLFRQLKEGISHAIRSIREKWPSANLGGARVALSALQSEIERRTTGPDGYPLRR